MTDLVTDFPTASGSLPASDRMRQPPMKVFVHLAHGFDAERWEAAWKRDEIVGINDRFPYGYYRAAEFGAEVTHSRDEAEGPPGKLLRLALRAGLGFDFLHAWRNRQGILGSQIVWTHTESQFLAVALLLRLKRRARQPKLLGQAVWLMDRWPGFSGLRRRFYSALLRRVDVLTFHSPDNLAKAREAFPDKNTVLVRYGICADTLVSRPQRPARKPIRVLAIGNDVHRDWPVLVKAFGGSDAFEARIVTRRDLTALLRGANNVSIHPASSNKALVELYNWADIVVVPLMRNIHVSGITVVQEATSRGLPVVCTDTGGLRAYFDDAAIRYVPVDDAAALREAVSALAADPAKRAEMVAAAQDVMRNGELNSRSYARRHVELSRTLLEG
jgi:glycosyltransferase involved in cell wall biosynthesis